MGPARGTRLPGKPPAVDSVLAPAMERAVPAGVEPVQADHADAWEHAPPAAPRDGFPGHAPIPRTPAPEMWLAKQTLTPPGLSLKTDTQFRYWENFLMLNFRNAKHIEYFQMKIYCPDLVRE